MRKTNKLIGESDAFKRSYENLKDKQHLLREARYALQKVLDLEREEPIFSSSMTDDISQMYRRLGRILDTMEKTISKATTIANRSEDELGDIFIEALADALGIDDDIAKRLKEL